MSRYQQHTRVMQSNIGEEVVMLDPESGYYFGLNSVAADVWHCLKAPAGLEEIVEYLLDKYEVDRESCTQQTEELLLTMLSKGVICCND